MVSHSGSDRVKIVAARQSWREAEAQERSGSVAALRTSTQFRY